MRLHALHLPPLPPPLWLLLASMPLPSPQRSLLPLARVSLTRQARPPADSACSRRQSAETALRTWRATGGLLRGERAALDELLLACAEGEECAGTARADAATGWGCCEARKGDEQEMLRLYDCRANCDDTCLSCNRADHWSRDCPHPRCDRKRGGATNIAESKVAAALFLMHGFLELDVEGSSGEVQASVSR